MPNCESQVLVAKWQEDDFGIIRGQKQPTQNFNVTQTDYYQELYDKSGVYNLSPKVQELGWTLNGFNVTHSASGSDFQILDSKNNSLKVALVDNRVEIKFYGEGVGVMQRFLCNFLQSVLPQYRLEFENLTDEQKKQKIKQKQLEMQQQREENDQRLKERQEQQRIQKMLDTLTEEDYEILRLRKEGASLWDIAQKLDVSIMRVRYKLQIMSRIPQLANGWSVGKPMNRREYLASKSG